jgi:hypothetical protein
MKRWELHRVLLSCGGNAEGHDPLPRLREGELWDMNAIACGCRLDAGDRRLGTAAEDERQASRPPGCEGRQVCHMRDEFGRSVDHDQAVFKENLKPVAPHCHLGCFLFLCCAFLRDAHLAAGDDQERADSHPGPEAHRMGRGEARHIYPLYVRAKTDDAWSSALTVLDVVIERCRRKTLDVWQARSSTTLSVTRRGVRQ